MTGVTCRTWESAGSHHSTAVCQYGADQYHAPTGRRPPEVCRPSCPHVWVPIVTPGRPCIRSPGSDPQPPPRDRRVVFADSRGFPLTAVRVFSDAEEQADLDPPGPVTGGGLSCAVSPRCPGTRLALDFPQPSADFRAFRARLAESMVVLESCSVSGRALRGLVRVRNVSFQKDVRVRVTFDSWRSCRDVPCAHVPRRFGGPQTDIFEFDVPVPKVLDASRRVEFCLLYRPAGHREPFWDNNSGRNYRVTVCASSHLCRGKKA